MNRFAFVAVLGSFAGMAGVASAGVEIGGTAGVHIFADDNALGTKTDDVVSHAASSLFAGRFSVLFTSMFGVELELGAIPTESGTEDVTFDVWMAVARANVIVQFRAADPTNRIIPFATAGGGAMRIVDIGTTDGSLLRKDTDGFGQVGAGVKYRAGSGWGVRLDARLLLVPSNEDKPVTQDFELLLSLYKDLGYKAKKKVEPVKDEDPDKDGISGASDQCPDDPEDKDDFEDENGCPDPDNDADGLLDGADTCPKEAEDKDNFKDEDGCPDPDNDEDGVPDAADKCVDQPETKNGFEDEDGCPDEVPATLAKFTGTIKGINFKVSSADLLPASRKVLDKAIAVLTEFKDVKVEVQGHTDDQPLRKNKKFDDNDALSQARAETVKAYFVKKGIAEDRIVAKGYGSTQPITDPTGLKGGKLNKARTQNRRVEFKLISPGDAGAAPAEPKPEETPAEPKPEETPAEPKPEPKADKAAPKADKAAAKAAAKADKAAPKADDKKGVADPFADEPKP